MATSVLKVEVLMEGYLYKRSPRQLLSLSIAQRRYFLLTLSLTLTHHQHFHLSYFRSADDHIPLGNVPLSHVAHVTPSETENGRFDIGLTHEARVYVLRCDNALEYSRWMEHLHRAMNQEGKRLTPPTPTPPPAPSSAYPPHHRASYPSASPPPHSYRSRDSLDGSDSKLARRDASALRQWEVKEAMDIMLAGTPVTLVTPPPSSAPSSPTVFTPSILLYKCDDTPLGSLYYCPLDSSAPPAPSPHCRLSLHNLTDIFLGRQSRAYLASLGSTNAPAASCCFSACTRVGVSLHVTAESRQVTSAWVLGINSVMMSQGQRRIRTKDRSSAPRRMVVPPSPSSSLFSVSSDGGLHIHSPEEVHEARRRPSTSSPIRPSRTAAKVDRAMEEWLNGLGAAFAGYYDAFVDNGVDLAFLSTLTVVDLDEVGVTRLHAKRIVGAIKEWKERGDVGETARDDDDDRPAAASATSTPRLTGHTDSNPPSQPSSAHNSIRGSPQVRDASALLSAMTPGSTQSSPYFPPPPILPQTARRESLMAADVKRASVDGKAGGAATSAIVAMLSALKVTGGAGPKGSNPLIAKRVS